MSKALARNTVASAVAGLSTVLGGFLSTVLVARMLGIEASGILAFAVWAVTVSVVLVDLGTPGTLARYLPELRARGDTSQSIALVRFLFGFTAIAAAAACAAYAGYALWLWWGQTASTSSHFRQDPIFWLLIGLACVTQAFANFVNGYLKGAQIFSTMARLAISSAALQLSATFLGGAAFGAVGALAGALAAGLLPLFWLPRILSGRGAVTPELKQRVVRFSWESWIGYLLTAFAWSRMEILFLERSWGSQTVALFSVSLTLANLATQGPLLLTGGLLPYLSQQSSLGPGNKAQEAYAVGITVLALLIFPACLGLAAICPVLLPAIYGQDFAGAVPSAIILVGGAAVSAVSSVAFTYLLAMERTRLGLLVGGASALLAVVVGLTAIPAFGVLGAAIARVAIQITMTAATVWYIGRELQCPTPYSTLARILTSALICAFIAWMCTQQVAGLPGVGIAIIMSAAAYGLAIRALHALPRRDTDRLVEALAVLPPVLRIPATGTVRLLTA